MMDLSHSALLHSIQQRQLSLFTRKSRDERITKDFYHVDKCQSRVNSEYASNYLLSPAIHD